MDVEMGIFIWSHYSRMSGGTDKNQGKSQNTQLSSQDLNHVFSGEKKKKKKETHTLLPCYVQDNFLDLFSVRDQ
jgi:hypothetical protein